MVFWEQIKIESLLGYADYIAAVIEGLWKVQAIDWAKSKPSHAKRCDSNYSIRSNPIQGSTYDPKSKGMPLTPGVTL